MIPYNNLIELASRNTDKALVHLCAVNDREVVLAGDHC